MTLPRIDFGSLTEEQTKQVAFDAMHQLSLDERIKAVLEIFQDADDRAELLAWLEEPPEEAA
jgi:hypothetical protein